MTLDRNQHYTLAADPTADAETLARLAEDHPELWPTLLANTSCYDELRRWIHDRQEQQPLTRPPIGAPTETSSVPLPPPPVTPRTSRGQILAGWTVGVLSISLVTALLILIIFGVARTAIRGQNTASSVSISALSDAPSPTQPWTISLGESMDPAILSCFSHTMSTFGQDRAVIVGSYSDADPTCDATTAERSATLTLLNTRNGSTEWSVLLADEAPWTAGATVENVSPGEASDIILQVTGSGTNPLSYLTLASSSGRLTDPALANRPADVDRYESATLSSIPEDTGHLVLVGTRAGLAESVVSYVDATDPMSPLWESALPRRSLPTTTVVGSTLVLSEQSGEGSAFDLTRGTPAQWLPAFNGTITPLSDGFVSYQEHPEGTDGASGTLRGFSSRGTITWQRDMSEAPQFSRDGLSTDAPSSSGYLSLFVTTDNGSRLMRLNPSTGENAWRAPAEIGTGRVWEQSGGPEDTIFAATSTGEGTYSAFVAINILDGTTTYTRASNGTAFQVLGLSPTVGYTTSSANDRTTLVAFDTGTNTTLWSLVTEQQQRVYLLGGQLVRYDPRTETLAQLTSDIN